MLSKVSPSMSKVSTSNIFMTIYVKIPNSRASRLLTGITPKTRIGKGVQRFCIIHVYKDSVMVLKVK